MKLHLGSRLHSIRDERRLSQSEMAELLRISTSTYSRIERNEASVEFEQLAQFAKHLDIAVQDLLPETISITSNSDRSGYVGGVVFGNQYFYINESERVNELKAEIELLKSKINGQSN
jgi:transcriptional regulator with XRE-family HTH domain